MPHALVLTNVEPRSEDTVLRELKCIEGMEEAYFSFGSHDIIAKVSSDTMDNLKELITTKISALPEVRSTLTLMIIQEQS